MIAQPFYVFFHTSTGEKALEVPVSGAATLYRDPGFNETESIQER